MTVMPIRPARSASFAAELRKLAAFVRRDFLVAWSYRMSFLTQFLSLFSAVILFYFVGRMVDPSKIPSVSGSQVSYLEFAVVGMALGGFVHFGLERVSNAMRAEQMMGTLESLLATPTASSTLQIGSVLFDLMFIPVRLGILLTVMSLVFGLGLEPSGIPQVIALLFVFLPFVWGLGVAAAAITMTYRRGAGIVGFAALGLTMVSNVYFPIALLPGWMQGPATASPIAVAVDGTRDALLGKAGWGDLAPTLLLLAPMSIASLAFGAVAFRLALRRERRLGTLGAY
jgi:ABC-2 type transport system permease protein